MGGSEHSRSQGFNEAPIHESGKFASGIAVVRQLLCFNEAPIHESGKYRFSLLRFRDTIPLQ